MPRCACGNLVHDNLGSVKVKDKRTGKLIKVICADCAIRPEAKASEYKYGRPGKKDKYRSWQEYLRTATEDEE